jgi:hypothetical protein
VPPGGDTLVTITGYKFYDANVNGVWNNPPEPFIGGWKITLIMPDDSTQTTYTGAANGQYSFQFLVSNTASMQTYTITEEFPGPDWHPTTATSGQVSYTPPGNPALVGPNFGNVCIGAGKGLTLGFWSNKNGQAVMTKAGMSGQLSFLSGLNLKKANGDDFNPSSYTAFRTWLLSATATNMAYMLSAQLAAMELNVKNGIVSGDAIVYVPDLSTSGFMTITDLMAAANTELGLHGLTLDGSPYRSYQENLKNALDKANNGQGYVQAGPCAFYSPY